MEKKSYPEILHNICVEFGHGEKSRSDAFEKAIVSLIDQIVTDEKKKALPSENNPKGEHYIKNDNIKNDCESCSRHDIIIGCTLKHKNKCMIDEKYTKYIRGHLLPCDRCKTYSVVTKIDMLFSNNGRDSPRPAIKFICLKCKDYPMINKGTFKGYELRGIEFTEKYLHICKQKEQQEKKLESEKPMQHIEQEKPIQRVEPEKPIQYVEPEKPIQSTEQEIEIIAISTE